MCGRFFILYIATIRFRCSHVYTLLESISLFLKASINVPFSLFWTLHTMMSSKCAAKSSIFEINCLRNLPPNDMPFSCGREAYFSRQAYLAFITIFKFGRYFVNAVLEKIRNGQS